MHQGLGREGGRGGGVVGVGMVNTLFLCYPNCFIVDFVILLKYGQNYEEGGNIQ